MYRIHDRNTGEHLDGGQTREQIKRALWKYGIVLESPLPRKGKVLLIIQPLYLEQAGKPSVVISVV